MKRNKFLSVIFIIVFLALLLTPLLRSFSSVDESTAWMEKRKVQEFPNLKLNKLDRFTKEFNSFFNDHLGFRKYIMLANAYVKNDLLKVSSSPNNVVFGKEGWLFLKTDKFCENYYMNVRPFTAAQLDTICSDIYSRYTFLKERNIDYYLFILPSKHHVYSEYMPDNIHRYDTTSRLDQFINHMAINYNYHVYNTLDTLLKTKNEYPYYFDRDTHWNLNGAAFVYTVVMEELKKKYPELYIEQCMNWEQRFIQKKHQGDLSLLMGRYDYKMKNHVLNVPPKGYKIDYEIIEAGNFKEAEKFLGPPQRYTSSKKSAPKALVIRDSYANLLMHYVATGFSETVYIWTHRFIPEIIEDEQPQIVIELMAERFLSELD